MFKNALRATALAALATAVAVPAALAGPSGAEPRPATAKPPVVTSVLKGEGRMDYPVRSEDVRIKVDAEAVFPADRPFRPSRTTGTFRIQHSYPARDGKPARTLWGDFKVDCLTTGGPTATVTGILVRTSPGHPWRTALDRHTRMGVSFYVPGGDGKNAARDTARIGLSGATAKGRPRLTRCMAPAADAAVVDGGYALKDRLTS
ncbi:hypothetical protein C9F11_14900 [Streptomyces sp. YIM 121038]|uniref:hypothetical protein n=1 Tax=Streptomyces sp. YIM 121038 TaxID=2136401 RepID=UPI00111019A6|nr:hypothetical protein [Streptomyces sp. YIM 121038]QCX76649.1 hypothetical protein C9F11_14900 [Streptomyces sp. YIM 121038]